MTPPNTTIDLTPLIETLIPFEVAVLAGGVAALKSLLERHKVANAADVSAKLMAVINTGAGLAHSFLAAHQDAINAAPPDQRDRLVIAVKNAALAEGVNHVLGEMPDALTFLGISTASLQQKVAGALGVLQANNPNISTGQPPQVPLPATHEVQVKGKWVDDPIRDTPPLVQSDEQAATRQPSSSPTIVHP